MILKVYTDGASRNNPGESASGYEIFDEKGKSIDKHSLYNGIKTNNIAEYIAIIEALKAIGKKYGYGNEIKLSSDSTLVINQLKGNYKVKDEGLKILNKEAVGLIKKFSKVELNNLPREDKRIVAVDKELNRLLDEVIKKI